MKNIFYIIIFSLLVNSSLFADQKCNELPGFKKIGKDSEEYIKCMAKKTKELSKKGLKKLNTDSKLTNWIKKKLNK
tara:strand:+ start:158 stop:385 length:228 start_codon:yes stop_codon:yes gene_type:complete